MSDREYVYVERWRESEDGKVIRISRLATEHAGAPADPGRVLLRAMCQQEMRQEGDVSLAAMPQGCSVVKQLSRKLTEA